MRAVIIDDELDARKSVRQNIERTLNHVEIVGEGSSVASGIDIIQNQNPDLIFLDISLSDGTGFDVLNKFKNRAFVVVFVTGYDNQAIKAFKYSAIDYLLKPIDRDDFAVLKEKLQCELQKIETQKRLKLLEASLQESDFSQIAFPYKNGTIYIDIIDITNLSADGSYTYVFSGQHGRVIVSRNLKEFEELLPAHLFMRIHKSHIVNLKAVKMFRRTDESIILHNGQQIPVSRRKKHELLDKLI